MSHMIEFFNGIMFASILLAGVLVWIISNSWLQGSMLIVALGLFTRAAMVRDKRRK